MFGRGCQGEGDAKGPPEPGGPGGSNRSLLDFFEVFLAGAAELADEVLGEVFPLGALLGLVIDPAAQLADVLFHGGASDHLK